MIAVNNDTWMLILLLAAVFGALMAIAGFSNRGSLDSIKSKDVGGAVLGYTGGGAENLPLRALPARAVAEGGAAS